MEEEVSKEFPNQKAEITLKINEFGVYIATIVFNKQKYNKQKQKKIYFTNKNNKKAFSKKTKKLTGEKVSRYEAVISQNRVYGKYKETRDFKPY